MMAYIATADEEFMKTVPRCPGGCGAPYIVSKEEENCRQITCA